MAAPGDDVPRSISDRRPEPRQRSIVVYVNASIVPTAIPLLCARVRALLATGRADVVACDVSAIAHPDVVTVDALARLQLTAQRFGYSIELRHLRADLEDLLVFVGLRDMLASWHWATHRGEAADQTAGRTAPYRESGECT